MVVSTGDGDCCCSGSEARIGECRLHSRHSGGSSHPPIPPAGPTRLIPPGFRVIRSTSTSSTFPPTPVSPFVCVVCGFEFFGPYDSSLPAARCDSAAPRACKSALSSATRCWGISCLCVGVGVCVCVCVCVCGACVRSLLDAVRSGTASSVPGPAPTWIPWPAPTSVVGTTTSPSHVHVGSLAPPFVSCSSCACALPPPLLELDDSSLSFGAPCPVARWGSAVALRPQVHPHFVFKVFGCFVCVGVLCVLLLCVCGCVCSVS